MKSNQHENSQKFRLDKCNNKTYFVLRLKNNYLYFIIEPE